MAPTLFARATGSLAALALAALASAPAEAGAKKYFLTADAVVPNVALPACGKGYHMASLWEILDPTLLQYDTKRGFARDDSGSGPPANVYGWVRTGYASAADNTPGNANCSAWASNLANEYGTAVALPGTWLDAPAVTQPWAASPQPCDLPLRVWCKQN